MIDFHAHLDLYPDPKAVVEECRRRALYVLSVTTTPSAWTVTNALAGGTERIRTAIGLHPQIAHERQDELPLFERFLPETRYVGEIGLDGSDECRPHWDAQIAVFEHILNACAAIGGRIMSIHSRAAAEDVLEHLERHPAAGTPVLHWFSGATTALDRAIADGCWFSVGPAMLRSKRGQALAAKMPRDRVLTESDGPFARIGGRSLMPWDADHAATSLSRIWSVSGDEARRILLDNFRTLLAGHHVEE